MIKNYYNKYWQGGGDKNGHANHIPRWPERELDMFYGAIGKFIGDSILDVGAGEGIFLEYLQKHNKNIKKLDALEISGQAIERGRRRNNSIKYFEGSADDVYPFSNNQYDTVFMTDVIEHLIDIDQAILECNRVMKINGSLIVITPVFNWLKKVIIASLFWDKFFYPTNPHVRFFTKNTMDLIMQKHGFERIFYRWGLSWFGIMPQNAYFVYQKVK